MAENWAAQQHHFHSKENWHNQKARRLGLVFATKIPPSLRLNFLFGHFDTGSVEDSFDSSQWAKNI